MAPEDLTEYERRRIENVKRNEEKLAALKIHSRASELSSTSKSQRPQYKSDNVKSVKKQKTVEPGICRRSPRLRGPPPDASTSGGFETPDKMRPKMALEFSIQRLHRERLSRQVESFSMGDAYRGNGSDRELVDLIRSKSIDKEGVADFDTKRWGCGTVKLDGCDLKPEHVARVVPGWITDVKLFPATDKTLVVARNKSGDIGFWNVDVEEDNGDGIHLYNPHSTPVSGVVIEPFSMSKIFTSSHDGFIMLMDIEREVFDSIYLSKYPVHLISGRPYDNDVISFSEGYEVFDIWDLRAGSSSSTWKLHGSRIHTIDFNHENSNLVATSCSNGTACIWDLRNISVDKPIPVKVVNHGNGVQSAYFSPSGRILATTRFVL
ncbi:hypothetical protein OROHE_025016 [Orobanche hederae]